MTKPQARLKKKVHLALKIDVVLDSDLKLLAQRMNMTVSAAVRFVLWGYFERN